MASVHPVFHVSMPKKCPGDPASILPIEGLGVDENLSYYEVPVEILDRQVKRLRNKEVSTVRVLWRNHLVEGATCDAKADMRFVIHTCSAHEVRYTLPKYDFVYETLNCSVLADFGVLSP